MWPATDLDSCINILLNAEERGAYRDALKMGAMIVKLSVTAVDKTSAIKALETMERVKPLLRADLGASVLIEEAYRQISVVHGGHTYKGGTSIGSGGY